MKSVNLVVGFTPYHALFAEAFMDNLSGPTYCFFTKRYPKQDKARRRIGFTGYPFLSFLIYSIIVRWWILSGVKINLYFPHLCHVSSNYLAFSGHCKTLNVYEEGIANYYDAKKDVWEISFRKSLLGIMSGQPYRGYAGHVTGIDSVKVDTVLASMPDRVVSKDKIGRVIGVSLTSHGQDIQRSKNKILFLDQPLEISNEDKRKLVNEFVLGVAPGSIVYYKPHHDCSSQYPGMVDLSKSDRELPAEVLLEKLEAGLVISFYSSALVNISRIFSDVDCCYLNAGPKLIYVNGEEVDIYRFLEGFGVKRYLEFSVA